MRTLFQRWLLILAGLVMLGATTGCGTTSIFNRGERNELDPFEPYNRTVFAINDKADQFVLKPVATVYQTVTPELFRFFIGNFFDNLGDVGNSVNSLLQGKLKEAGTSGLRFLINSTFGFGGIADVATDLGLEIAREDLGQTFGVWGIPTGPYLVLPLLGPTTVRDFTGTVLSWPLQPLNRLRPSSDQAWLRAIQTIDTRAYLLKAGEFVDGAALDRYTFVRNAYIQRRLNLVYDGNPPSPVLKPEDDPERDAPPKPDGKPVDKK
jgi:phospholipid-binding lipoprotein MlaA